MKGVYAPAVTHYVPRPDWTITDEQYAAWDKTQWIAWHCECPIWFVWNPDPKKPDAQISAHFNREGLLTVRLAALDAAGMPYQVHTVRNPSHSLAEMLERSSHMTDSNQSVLPTPVTQPRGAYAQVQPTVDGRPADQPVMTEPAPPPTMTVRPDPASITIEDLARIDLRIGCIVAAERVPKSDKLLKLQVDLGEDKPRQILAGIGKGYSPEEVIGKSVTVVANLPPRKMMGHESQGMILATGDSPEDLALLSPTRTVRPGSRVR